MSRRATHTQRGLGAIAAIVVLVGMAVLAAAIVRLGSATQAASAGDLQSARAEQAARAGIEWGLYQAFKGTWTSCSGASQNLDLSASTGLWVTVSCDSQAYNEGETTPGVARVLRAFTIDAVACSVATGCPDAGAATQAGYVERRRQVQAVNQ
jgi:MSHA biogenesis protein MshP